MTSRTRFLITAALVCHLLVAPAIVTSQLLSTAEPAGTQASPSSAPSTVGEEEVTIRTLQQEKVALNRKGTTGLRLPRRRLILTSSNPFAFTGKVMETAPDHYVIYDGTITTCELHRPKWEFNARKVVVEVGGNASIYHSTFRIEGVPVFYFPFATHPVERLPRQTGLLIPNVGRSSIKGTIFRDSIFWAINRSLDLTAGAEYFTRRGWAPQVEFRARPSEDSYPIWAFCSIPLCRRPTTGTAAG